MTDSSNEPIDLRDLLDAPGTQFPDRPNLPGAKTFYGKLTGGVDAMTSRNKGTPFFRIHVRLTDAGKDVPKSAMDKLTAEGFSLADYDVYSDFYLTPKAMSMIWRFLESVGFNRNNGIREQLRLDENYNPTADTSELLRGLDVICRTQPADENGRVFANLDMLMGNKDAKAA